MKSRWRERNITFFRKGLWATARKRHMKTIQNTRKGSISYFYCLGGGADRISELMAIIPVLLSTIKPLSYKRGRMKYEEAKKNT